MPTAADFVHEASSFIGTPYVWGGASPKGFDCSGLVEYSLTQLGLRKVPRTSEKQYAWADPVDARDVEAGDLVFFHFPGEQGAGHVAIFAGKQGRGPNAKSSVIQAPKPGGDVQRVPFTPLPAGSHEWGGTILGYGKVPGLDYQALTLEALWLHAGGPPKVAKTMAAIALAESGGRVGAIGGPNPNGTYDYGLWQINSSHRYAKYKLLHDAGYNARAAVAVYHSQGLQAWSTYSSGAYKAFLSQAAAAQPLSRPPRPAAGGAPDAGGGSGDSAAASAAQAAVWASYTTELDATATPASSSSGGGTAGAQPANFNPFQLIPGIGPLIPAIPNPLKAYEDAQAAVKDLGTFLSWIAWLFSPRNILRVVEFLAGAGLMLVAARFALEAGRSSSSSESGPTGKASRTIKRTLRATPPGRQLALATAAAGGRRTARSNRRKATATQHREEEKRARKKAQRKEEARRKPGESRRAARRRRREEEGDVPF